MGKGQFIVEWCFQREEIWELQEKSVAGAEAAQNLGRACEKMGSCSHCEIPVFADLRIHRKEQLWAFKDNLAGVPET